MIYLFLLQYSNENAILPIGLLSYCNQGMRLGNEIGAHAPLHLFVKVAWNVALPI